MTFQRICDLDSYGLHWGLEVDGFVAWGWVGLIFLSARCLRYLGISLVWYASFHSILSFTL